MTRSISYHDELMTSLQEPSEAVMYLEVVLEEGDPLLIHKALLNVIEAAGGLEGFSASFKTDFDRLTCQLQASGEIEFTRLQRLLAGLGLRVVLRVAS